jgi:hypothetical protein
MKILLLITLLSSCALQRSVDVNPKKIETRQDRILGCLDKYMGEGLKNAYSICKDLYTLE